MTNIYQSFGFLLAKASQKMQEEWKDWLDNHTLSPKELGVLAYHLNTTRSDTKTRWSNPKN